MPFILNVNNVLVVGICLFHNQAFINTSMMNDDTCKILKTLNLVPFIFPNAIAQFK